MSAPPIVIIANPAAGSGRAAQACEDLARALHALGLEVEMYRTGAPGEATEKALTVAAGRTVVAVGGDGTFREVVAALIDQPVTVGFFPTGTANMMAWEYHLPTQVREAAEVIAKGHTLAIDLGRANGQPFTLCAGVGLDGAVVREIAKSRAGTLSGFHAYVKPIFAALPEGARQDLRVRVDGETVSERATMALVANGRNYGGIFEIAGYAQPTDGYFDICLFEKPLRWYRLIQALFLGLIRRLPKWRHLRYFRGRNVEVESGEPGAPYQVDGDFGGQCPVRFEIIPEGARLLVPAEFPGSQKGRSP